MSVAEQVGRTFPTRASRWVAVSHLMGKPTMVAGADNSCAFHNKGSIERRKVCTLGPVSTLSLVFLSFSPSISTSNDVAQASCSPGIDCHSFLQPLVTFCFRVDHSNGSNRHPLLDSATAHAPAWQLLWPPSLQPISSPLNPIRPAAPLIPFGRSRLAHVWMTCPARVQQTSHVQETSPI